MSPRALGPLRSGIHFVVGLTGLMVAHAALAMSSVPPSRPEPPLIMRDVSRIDDQFRFNRPQIPGNRTTMDGRVALVAEGGTGTSGSALERNLFFSLHVPERLTSPIMTGPAGAEILNTSQPVVVPVPSKRLFLSTRWGLWQSVHSAWRLLKSPLPMRCGDSIKSLPLCGAG